MNKTIKVKAGDLTGVALDWAVDAAETGDPMRVEYKKDGSGVWMLFDKHNMYAPNGPQKFSTDWKLAGPIIARERMSFSDCIDCFAAASKKARTMYGPSHLIAAMRCYVAAKLGDEIEVPAELAKGGA